MTFRVIWRKSQPMIDAKLIRQVLDKFLKAENVKTARMQVRTLDGVITILSLLSYWKIKLLVQEKHIE